MCLCARDASSHSLPPHFSSASPPLPSPSSLHPGLSAVSPSGHHICSLFPLEYLLWASGCREAGLLESGSNVGLGMGAGRGWGGEGEGEYKYVSGNTNERGGEVESERKVLPLLQVKENTILSLVNVAFCIFLLLCFRGTALPHAKPFCLRTSWSDEEDREDCREVEGKRERIKAGNLPWLGLTHG